MRRITEIDVNSWKWKYDGRKTAIDKASIGKLLELRELIYQFELIDDKYLSVWAKADAPSLEEFSDSIRREDDFSDYSENEIKRMYESSYAKNGDGSWFQITLSNSSSDKDYFCVFLDTEYVLSTDNYYRASGERCDVTEFVNWIIGCVKRTALMVEEGSYDQYIEDVPYTKRKGVIRRSDYYAILPAARAEVRARLSDDEIDEFMQVDYGPNKYENQMTAGRFFDACSVVYDAVGMPWKTDRRFLSKKDEAEVHNITSPRQKYYEYSDGLDNDLIDVPIDDPAAFSKWFDETSAMGLRVYAWDLISSCSRTNAALNLSVEKTLDEGKYFFRISGNNLKRTQDTIKGFLALRKAGYPVSLGDGKVIAGRLTESDYIGIIDDTSYHCYENICGHNVIDFIGLENLEDKITVDRLISTATWEELSVVKLKKAN